MPSQQSSIQQFASLRDRLAFVLADVAEVFRLTNIAAREREVLASRSKLLEDRLRVLIMGEMKRGKSTFTNALLGEQLLPTRASTVCTAIPTLVRHAERKHAICERRPPETPEEFDLVRDPGALWRALTVPSKEHGPRPDSDSDAAAMLPYVRATVLGPFEICRNGVEIEDSPGLNEGRKGGERRGAMTWDESENTDAAIAVWSSTNIGLATELSDIEGLVCRIGDPRVVFVVVNHFKLRGESADRRESAQKEAIAALEPLGILPGHVFCLDAAEALAGRIEKRQEEVESSGILAFERRLGGFLLTERSAAKLLPPLNIAENALEEALADVVARQAYEPANLVKKTQEGFQRAQDGYRNLQRIRTKTEEKMRSIAERLSSAVSDAARGLMDQLASGIPGQLATVDISNGQAVFSRAETTRMLVDVASAWCKARAQEWDDRELPQVVHEYVAELREYVSDAVEKATQVRDEVAGVRERLERSTSELDRVLSTNLGPAAPASKSDAEVFALVNSVLGSGAGGVAGTSGVLGATMAGGVVGAWFAVILALPVLFPIVVAMAAAGAIFGIGSASKRLKASTAAKIQEHIRAQAPELTAQVVAAVNARMKAAIKVLLGQLDARVESVRKDQGAIGQMHALAEQRANELRELYTQMRSRLQQRATELSALRREIDPTHNTDRLAEKVAALLKLDPSRPAAGTDQAQNSASVLSKSQLEAKLGPEAIGRLSEVQQVLKTEGHWKAEYYDRLLAIWAKLDGDADAPMQVPIYRAVTAMALASDREEIPKLAEVRRWFDDESMREELLDLYNAIEGEDHAHRTGFRFDRKTKKMVPSTKEEAVANFVKAYERAASKVLPQGEETRPARKGTVIEGSDRDAEFDD